MYVCVVDTCMSIKTLAYKYMYICDYLGLYLDSKPDPVRSVWGFFIYPDFCGFSDYPWDAIYSHMKQWKSNTVKHRS